MPYVTRKKAGGRVEGEEGTAGELISAAPSCLGRRETYSPLQLHIYQEILRLLIGELHMYVSHCLRRKGVVSIIRLIPRFTSRSASASAEKAIASINSLLLTIRDRTLGDVYDFN
jgi:hypothetical protein